MIEALLTFLVALSAVSWIGFALLPWGLWRNRDVLKVIDADEGAEPLAEVTAVIPARNEAEIIQRTVLSVLAQGPDLQIILIDDRSEDGTAEMVDALARSNLRIVRSAPLPDGWSGKLWALEQGRQQVTTPYTLFLDADIELARGGIKALKDKMHRQPTAFVSLMAAPPMASTWEKLLMPAYVYFFKALYPFALVNSPSSKMAAAAGGCILVETRVLEQIGGFEPLKAAVIDDCAFARRVKLQGFKIWLGLTHAVKSIRAYKNLGEIGDMVARSAFAQLHFSLGLLLFCTCVLLLLYVFPAFMVASSNNANRYLALTALGTMLLTYLPTLGFYRRSWAWALCLPVIAGFFLVMTWTSAIRYWCGERTRWKGRVYRRAVDVTSADEPFR